MEPNKYFNKYKKYKKKYLELKNRTHDMKIQREIPLGFDIMSFPFYFIHQTDPNNFKLILKSGVLKKGKDVPAKRRHGALALNYVFTSIYFEDLNNISQFSSNAFIISPAILNDYDAGFNVGWRRDFDRETVILYKKDDAEIKEQKIHMIRNKLKQIDEEDEDSKIAYGWHNNEVLFQHEIPLDKYLIGIVCTSCKKDKYNEQINKLASKYNDIPIITEKNPMPKLSQLIN